MPTMARRSPDAPSPLSSLGHALAVGDDAFGYLRTSNDIQGSAEALRSRLDEDGYLYIRNFLPVELIDRARLSVSPRCRPTIPTHSIRPARLRTPSSPATIRTRSA